MVFESSYDDPKAKQVFPNVGAKPCQFWADLIS